MIGDLYLIKKQSGPNGQTDPLGKVWPGPSTPIKLVTRYKQGVNKVKKKRPCKSVISKLMNESVFK